jgi:uncharacterized protein with PIN domain
MFSRRKRAEIVPPTTPCPDCGGRRVHASGSYEMNLLHPKRGRALSRLEASACLQCGRVYFYAVELEKLREAFTETAAEQSDEQQQSQPESQAAES